MPKENPLSQTSLIPKEDKSLTRNASFASEQQMYDLEAELPKLLSRNSTYSAQTATIEIGGKIIFILPSITETDKKELAKSFPLLAKRLPLNGVNQIGTGTFSIVRLVYDNGEFKALREILDSKELASHFKQPIERGSVLFDTMHEIEAHDFLASTNAGDYVFLIETAVLAKQEDKTQIFQIMRLAEGTGLNIKDKSEYFNSEEREKIFLFFSSKLLIAMDELHQRKVAHNDIKLANILFTLAGFLGFADLGAVSFFLDKLKKASPLKDERYVAPYPKPHEKLTELELLQRDQRGDLWALALTLIELWDSKLIDNFFENSLVKSKEIAKPSPAQIKIYDESDDGCTYSTEITHDIVDEPKRSKSKLEIYKEALLTLFASPSFKKIPLTYQKLFKVMLDLDDSDANMKLTLNNIFEKTNFYPETQPSLDLLQKFITVPDNKFDETYFKSIKEKIKILLNKFSKDKVFNIRFLTVLNNNAPADFATSLLPLVEQIKAPNLNSNQFFTNLEENIQSSKEFRQFVELLEKLCKGEINYLSLNSQLTSLESPLNTIKQPLGLGPTLKNQVW